MKLLYLRTCPRCGERAALLTIRHVNGHVAKAVCCSSHSCSVNTGFTYEETFEVVQRWNKGIGLEFKNGRPYMYRERERPYLATIIEI